MHCYVYDRYPSILLEISKKKSPKETQSLCHAYPSVRMSCCKKSILKRFIEIGVLQVWLKTEESTMLANGFMCISSVAR
jgi:hypothetical protein